MKRFIIDGEIGKEIVEKFVSLVDDNPNEIIKIYLTSDGGLESGMLIMLDIINAQPDKFEIYAIERIYSCAFELFFMSRCKRTIATATLGMCHLSSCEMKMMANNEPRYDGDKAMLKADVFRNKQLKAFLMAIGISSKDQEEIMKGEDVFFQEDALKSFLAIQATPYCNRQDLIQERRLSLQEPSKEGVQEVPAGI